MSRKYTTKEFLDLQTHWYRTLKNSGFECIESFLPESPFLTRSASKTTSKIMNNLDTAEFMRIAGMWFHSHDWTAHDVRDEILWGAFCDGHTLKETSNALKGMGFTHRTSIFYLSRRLIELKALMLSLQNEFTQDLDEGVEA